MEVDSYSRDRQGYVSSWSTALHEGVCGRGGIAPLIHLGARLMVKFSTRPLYPRRKIYCVRYTGGWVDLRVALEVVGN